MLALLTATLSSPVDEPVDRDSGVLTLAFALARGLRRHNREAAAKSCDRAETDVSREG
ncbi:hypothetical protein [Methylobacterium trifolii]|uniref:Uncharacterized protein n=1 Tax=Methylobacterium trifolii TaxID=1003092 RepID=A0ABQ4TRH6_9HYPH|nr:hypothetical protein [Methylobacterium trifolii]GJE57958.1 hypothetical protein MPOCJGCO_0034 [Methylobacterium trifolii]